MKVIQPEPEKKIAIEFTEEEATVLCALVGGVTWNFDTKAGNVLRDFFSCLDGELPDRVHSFIDLFEGQVTVKP